MKTRACADTKYLRRLPRWGPRGAVTAVGLLLGLGVWAQWQQPAAGTDLYLQEGPYSIVTILDPITFVCEPLEPADAPDRGSPGTAQLTVRLLGVALPNERQPGSPDNAAALQLTLDFLRRCPGQQVELRFDPHRFDSRLIPLARLIDGPRELNTLLLEHGVVRRTDIPGVRRRPASVATRRPDPVEGVARE